MSQELGDDLAVYLGLQGFGVESVAVVLDRRYCEPQRRVKLIRVIRRSGLHQCPDCNRGLQRGLFDEAETVRFRDSSIGDFETYVEAQAVRCDFSVGYELVLSAILPAVALIFREWVDFEMILQATGLVVMAELFNSAIEAVCGLSRFLG